MRVTVTFEAEGHAQRLGMLYLIHLIDLAVAFHAGNTPIHMNSVVKINIVRGLVNLHPGYRLVFGKALSDWLKSRIVCQHRGVTFHARLSRRNVRKPRLVHVVVAVPAVNTHLSCVDLVREGNWLNGLIPYPSIFRGKIIGNSCNNTGTSHQTTHH